MSRSNNDNIHTFGLPSSSISTFGLPASSINTLPLPASCASRFGPIVTINHTDFKLAFPGEFTKFTKCSTETPFGAVDGTFIYYGPSSQDKVFNDSCHTAIYMKDVSKYFCTHCLNIVNKDDIDAHIASCYIALGESTKDYCFVCNYKIPNSLLADHYNSSKHQNRVEFLQHIHDKKKCYVNDYSATFIDKSLETVLGYNVSLNFLQARLDRSLSDFYKVSHNGSKRLHSLIKTILTTTSGDPVQTENLFRQRKSIVKCLNFFRAELAADQRLCYPRSLDDDFINVINCADAIYEIQLEKINNSGVSIDEKEEDIRALMAIFGFVQTKQHPEYCSVCLAVHQIEEYAFSFEIDEMVVHLIDQLEQH